MTGGDSKPVTVAEDIQLTRILDGIAMFSLLSTTTSTIEQFTSNRPIWCSADLLSQNTTTGSIYHAEINRETSEVTALTYQAGKTLHHKSRAANRTGTTTRTVLMQNNSDNPLI